MNFANFSSAPNPFWIVTTVAFGPKNGDIFLAADSTPDAFVAII